MHINLQGEKNSENGICATQYKSQLEQSIKNNKKKKAILIFFFPFALLI